MSNFRIFAPRTHVCSVPGCRGRDTFIISRSEGALHSLYLCRDCINDVYRSTAEYDKEKRAEKAERR